MNAGENLTYTVAEVFPEYLGKEVQIALRAYRTRENLTQRGGNSLLFTELYRVKRPPGTGAIYTHQYVGIPICCLL